MAPYTAKNGEARLTLRNEAEDQGVKENRVEIEAGTIGVPSGSGLYANGVEVKATKGEIDVSKDGPTGKVTVTIPSGSTATVNGKSYSGAMTVEIDQFGDITENLPDFYVKSTGYDSYAGTKEKPFKTMSKAIQAANATSSGANIHVLDTVSMSASSSDKYFTINAGKTINVIGEDANGVPTVQKLNMTYSVSRESSKCIFTINGQLNFDHITLDGGKSYDFYYTLNGACVISIKEGGGLTLGPNSSITNFKVTVSGNNSSGRSFIINYGNFEMDSTASLTKISPCGSLVSGNSPANTIIRGTITGNTCGSYVFYPGGSKFVVDGANISGNTASAVISDNAYYTRTIIAGNTIMENNTNSNSSQIGATIGDTTSYNAEGLSDTAKVQITSSNTTTRRFATNVASREVIKRFEVLNSTSMAVVYCDGKNGYWIDDLGRKIMLTSIQVNGKVHEHSANTLWLVNVNYLKIPYLYISNYETPNPPVDATEGSPEYPFTVDSLLKAIESSDNIPQPLQLALSNDLNITPEQLEKLLEYAEVTFITDPSKEDGRYSLKLQADSSGDNSVTLGEGKSLTLDNVTA